jgi:uncharacterized membrane protein YozB (DUF420 family)
VLLLAFGIIKAKVRKIHVPVMITAFILDVGLVLWIELSRQAVERVAAETNNTFLLFHAAISLLVIVLYILLLITGSKFIKHGERNIYLWHKRLAVLFIVLRLTNYVTSFFVAD